MKDQPPKNFLFRVIKVRIKGKYKLLKAIHRGIIRDLLYSILYTSVHNTKECFINPNEFENEINKAQSDYIKSLNYAQ